MTLQNNFRITQKHWHNYVGFFSFPTSTIIELLHCQVSHCSTDTDTFITSSKMLLLHHPKQFQNFVSWQCRSCPVAFCELLDQEAILYLHDSVGDFFDNFNSKKVVPSQASEFKTQLLSVKTHFMGHLRMQCCTALLVLQAFGSSPCFLCLFVCDNVSDLFDNFYYKNVTSVPLQVNFQTNSINYKKVSVPPQVNFQMNSKSNLTVNPLCESFEDAVLQPWVAFTARCWIKPFCVFVLLWCFGVFFDKYYSKKVQPV